MATIRPGGVAAGGKEASIHGEYLQIEKGTPTGQPPSLMSAGGDSPGI